MCQLYVAEADNRERLGNGDVTTKRRKSRYSDGPAFKRWLSWEVVENNSVVT